MNIEKIAEKMADMQKQVTDKKYKDTIKLFERLRDYEINQILSKTEEKQVEECIQLYKKMNKINMHLSNYPEFIRVVAGKQFHK